MKRAARSVVGMVGDRDVALRGGAKADEPRALAGRRLDLLEGRVDLSPAGQLAKDRHSEVGTDGRGPACGLRWPRFLILAFTLRTSPPSVSRSADVITQLGVFRFGFDARRSFFVLSMSSESNQRDQTLFLRELREARELAGMTQVELAKALRTRQTYVSKCELGQRRLDILELRAWVTALGGDLSTFVQALEDRLSRHSPPPPRR